jgi:D-3-phosphoglycerate dehydrogenase / 2-oxoglutarate reductase
MRVLIADKLSKRMEDALRDLGVDMDIRPDLTAEQLPDEIGQAQALVVRSTKVSAETINAGGKLSLIVRAGAGVNTIDTAAASSRGIYVTNCPGMNSAAVAELAIGLLVACDRRIVDASADLRAGKWRKKEYGKARGLRGRTLGILGAGMIGQAVAAAARGLGMRVAAWSRSLDPERAAELKLEYCDSPLALAKCSDAVSVHLASAPETKGLVDSEFLQAMGQGAIFINTSRGEVVDQEALAQAIAQRGLRVGLDVFANEPSGGESEFSETQLARSVTATPHIGASTEQASDAVADDVARIIKAFHQTGKPPRPINMCLHSPATHSLVIRHYNRVGVLAGILDLLREEDINVEEMENTIFDGAQAACCTLQLDAAPSQAALAALEQNELILQVTSGSR